MFTISREISVAIAAPLTPNFSVYIRMGSIIMFMIAAIIIAYIGLCASPSLLSIPYIEFEDIISMDPIISIVPYSSEYFIVFPAPRIWSMGFSSISRSIVVIIDVIIVIISVCMLPLSALFLFFSPMYLEIADDAPAPSPFPIPTNAMNMGFMYPTPASASAPKPDTQNVSIRLYRLVINSDIINGVDSLISAFFGFPSIDFTPCVCIL